MTTQATTGLPAKLNKKAFYDWLEGQEGKYELENGRVVMVKVTRGHWMVASNIVHTLRNLLSVRDWFVGGTEFAVEIGEQVRFPDGIVEPVGGDVKELETTCAVMLVEVLSPSSVGRDFNLKLSEYTTLDSVEAYLIASQDEPICWLWHRAADVSRAFPEHPAEIKGLDQSVALQCLGIALPLKDVYQGVFS